MDRWLKQYRFWLADPRIVFGVVGFSIGCLGLLLMLTDSLPFGGVNLAFFTMLTFLVALYRPNWVFLTLVATLPFETIHLLPETASFSLRPYQWLFMIVSLALAIRILTRRTTGLLFRFEWLDFWLALVPIGALISGGLFGGVGVHHAVIVVSFYALYLLGRIFLRTSGDVSVATVVLSASGLVSLGYGIAQNIAFEQGKILGAVMPGRPNGTFAEPDWLGLFAVIIFFFFLSHLEESLRDERGVTIARLSRIGWLMVPLTLVLVTIILTVSRSAWLAACLALVVWVSATLIAGGKTVWRSVLQSIQVLVITFVLALLIIIDIPLTRFDLLNRAGSTATGLQEITVACPRVTDLPTEIASIDELGAFGCYHINLEERETLAARGQSIQTVYRPDPNVVIRSNIYARSWEEMKQHPVFGIGWGNIGTVLGRDQNGAAYNASNLWFEVWLGAGLMGLIGLIGACGVIVWRAGRVLLISPSDRWVARAKNGSVGTRAALGLSLLTSVFVFNLFNAGLLIGFVWIGFACFPAFSREQ